MLSQSDTELPKRYVSMQLEGRPESHINELLEA